MTLHADACQLLAGWSTSDPDQDRLRHHVLQHLVTHTDGVWRSCAGAHLTASALVVSHDRRRVLLTLHAKAGLWLQTGGHLEPGDPTVTAAALREATEESGIPGLQIEPGPARLSRHAVPFCRPVEGADDEPPTEHLDVQFIARAPAGALAVRSEESADLRWFDVDDLPAATDDDLRALVRLAR